MKLEIGAPVFHHGRVHHVTRLFAAAAMLRGEAVVTKRVEFANEAYTVTANADDLSPCEALGCFVMEGRILARNERVLAEAVIGAWPASTGHLAMAAAIDAIDLEAVDMEKLAATVKKRKPEIEDPNKYATALLKQVAQIRETRRELQNA